MNVVVRAIGSRFGTSFDAAATKALLPAVIVGGRDPSLDLADGLTRSPSIVGRFTTVAILGFNVESDGRPVRVSLQLIADSKTGPTPRLIELVGTRASPRSPSSMSRIEAWKAANRPMCRLSFPPKTFPPTA